MAELVLEHSQQIGNHVQPFRQQADPLVHLEIGPHGLVHWFELGFNPKELGRVEDGAVQVDVDSQDEELAYLHVDLRLTERNLARQSNLRRDVLARVNRRGD